MVMMMENESLSMQLQRLRHLFLLLETVPDSRQHDELIDRTRLAIAAVRKTRATLSDRTATAS
jgi:hypothetical protein